MISIRITTTGSQVSKIEYRVVLRVLMKEFDIHIRLMNGGRATFLRSQNEPREPLKVWYI